MDTKLLNLCSVVCLVFCYTCAAEQPKKGDRSNTVGAILQDLQMAAGEHYHDEGGHDDKGYFSKEMKGGYDKGNKKYGMDEYNKKGADHGKSGLKKHDSKDKWGTNKWDKKGLDSHGEKWGDKSGKENKGKWEEWADNKKWKTDKGKGYEKAYEYDKSDGKKSSYGKKGKNNMSKYEDKHGEKHGLKKKEAGGKDNYGKKMNNGKMKWDDWAKMNKASGKHKKGMNNYESKKPSTHKSSKWEKKQKKQKKMPPKKMEHHEEMEHDGQGPQEEEGMGGGEEDHGYDAGGEMEGQEMDGGEYDHGGGGAELAYDDSAPVAGQEFMTQEEAYAALAQAGYVMNDQGAAIPLQMHETDMFY